MRICVDVCLCAACPHNLCSMNTVHIPILYNLAFFIGVGQCEHTIRMHSSGMKSFSPGGGVGSALDKSFGRQLLTSDKKKEFGTIHDLLQSLPLYQVVLQFTKSVSTNSKLTVSKEKLYCKYFGLQTNCPCFQYNDI